MQNPIPNYQIPYPYGDTKKQEVLEFADKMIEKYK